MGGCALFQKKFIYKFGSYVTTSFERLNGEDIDNGWEIVNFEGQQLESKEGYACFEMSDHEILIFGGKGVKTFVYDLKTNQIRGHVNLEIEASFHSPIVQPVLTDNCIYAPDKDANIHQYSLRENKWTVLSSKKWIKHLY